MGAVNKKQTVTLQLDLDLPKGKIKEFGELLGDATKIKMDSGKGKDIFNSVNLSLKEATVEAAKLIKVLNKPMKNSGAAKQWGQSFEQVFKGVEGKLFNIQGNLSRIFNSKENQEALQLYKELGEAISKMQSDYDKVAKKSKKRTEIGSASAIKAEIASAKKERKELEKNQGSWTKAEKDRYKELNQIIEDGNKKLDDREKITKSIAKIHKNQGVSGQGELAEKIKTAKDQQSTIGSGMFSLADLEALNSLITEYRGHLRIVIDDMGDLGTRSEDTWDQINNNQLEAANRAKTLKDIFKGFGLGFGLTDLIRGLKQLAMYSYDFYKGLDKALTEISVVTRKTRSEVQSLTKDFISMAKQTGMSIDDVAKGAVIFFQQGLSDEEALKMTQVAAEFAKVADISVESASDKLTAAVNGYNMAVSQAADVADKLNVLAAESAASIDELATAMEKGASMASQAGLSFDQYNAILATMIEVTREAPENIGTSMKTIMARFQQIKEAGTTEDGDTDVNAVETALKSVGVSLRDEQGILRDLGDVLDELGPKWQSLDRNTQAYLGTVIAGTRQQSRFISLMQNWDRALELTTASEQSAGAQALQHQLAMEGLEASINNLTIAWQNFLTKLTSSDLFKGVIDSLTAIVKIFSSLNVKSTLFSAAMIVGVVRLNKYLNATREALKEDGSIKTGWMYQLNELLRNQESAGIMATLQQLKQAWKDNKLTAWDFVNTTSVGMKQLWDSLKGGVINGVKKLGEGLKTAAKNAKDLFKQMAAKNPAALIGAIAAIGTAIGSFIDGMVFDGDKKLEKANKELDETLNKMEIASGKLSVISSNLDTYLDLSDAISLSVQEQEKLNNATAALAENVQDAVIGYDEMGRAILDVNKIQAAKDQAKQDQQDAARASFGNIGNSIAADLEARGEQAQKDKKIVGGITAASGAAAGAAVGALLGTVVPVIGNAIGAVGGAIIGAGLGLVTGWITSAAGAAAEERKLAVKEYGKLLREHQEELLKAMDTITDTYVTYGENIYDEFGRTLATKDDKQLVAANMQSSFLSAKTKEIGDQVKYDGLSADAAAEKLEKLGEDWESLLQDIGDEGVNAITAQAMTLKKAVDTENKSWNEIRGEMADTLDNLNIPEESRKAIEEAFKASVYSGTSKGVYQAMLDLENQQSRDTSREAYDTEVNKRWWQFWKDSYDEWKTKMDQEYRTYWDTLNNMSADKLDAYGKLGITGNKDVMELYNSKYSSSLEGALGGSDAEVGFAGLSGLYAMQDEIEAQMKAITDKTSDEYKKWEQMSKDTAAAITKAWASIPQAVEPTWAQLFEQYEEFSERISKVRETLAEVGDDGGIDYDQFKELTTLFDDIDTDYLNGAALQDYARCLNTIADNLTVVNGELQLNETALNTIGEIEGALAQNQIDATKAKLEAKKAEMEAQRSMIVADKSYMEAQLEVAKSVVNGTYKEQEATANLDAAKRNFTDNARRLLETYTENEYNAAVMYTNTWTTAFDKVADEYNKIMLARAEGKTVDTTVVTELDNTIKVNLKPTTEGMYDFSKMTKEDAAKAVAELEKKIAAAQHAIDSYDVSIGNINLKLALLNSGIKTTKEGFEDQKALDEYLSKLERFLNLLRHIEREEANLNIAGQLKEMQTGKAVIDRIGNELEYVQHLIKDTAEMYQNYENEANTSAADIRKGFGDIVTFDPWGNYEVDMAAYEKLSDEEKKLLDESLEAYDELIDSRDKYYEDHLKYIKQEIDLNQEYVDAYIKAEDELVEAIKQREQDILDNKLAAIDKEIEAIERAADARRKAREEEKEAQELSGLQTDLQRALMDSSGASASQILDIQKQIKDKQQEIADNSFDTMVEDMTTQLEEEKELEQRLFDERLEEMDWYWDEVDRIMAEGTDSIMDTMKLYLDEFNQSSEVQQAELIKGWENTFEQAIAIGKKGAQDYQKIISGLQDEANKLTVDEDILTDETINTAFDKRPEVEKETGGSGGSGGSNGGATSNNKYLNYNKEDKPKGDDKPEEKVYSGVFTNSMIGETVEMKPGNGKQIVGYVNTDQTGQSYSYTDKKGYDHNFKFRGDAHWAQDWNGGRGAWVGKFQRTGTGAVAYFPLSMSGEQANLWTYKEKYVFKKGGMANFTGPAWLDGTPRQPEAVLNALQTKAFLSFTDDLAALRANGGITNNSSVFIDTIAFNVDSMSSVADGEKAFNAFVDRFKEIGAKQGISVLGTMNRN